MIRTRESLSTKFSTHQTTLIMVQNLVNIPGSSIRTRAGRTRTGSDILVSVRTFKLSIILLLLILLNFRPRTRAYVRPGKIYPTPSVSVQLCPLRPPQNGTSSASVKIFTGHPLHIFHPWTSSIHRPGIPGFGFWTAG